MLAIPVAPSTMPTALLIFSRREPPDLVRRASRGEAKVEEAARTARTTEVEKRILIVKTKGFRVDGLELSWKSYWHET